MTEDALVIEDLSVFVKEKTHGKAILKNLSFVVPERARLGIVGYSGAGKTTLAFAVTQLLSPSQTHVEGRISFFDGPNIVQMTPKERRNHVPRQVAIILQDAPNSLDPFETLGAQLVEVIRFYHRNSRTDALFLARRYLEKVGLASEENIMNHYPHQLSGGMKQRAAIALSLARKPRILVADEPTASLDGIHRLSFVRFLERLCDEERMTVLYISHDLGLVSCLCDRVLVLDKGEKVEEGYLSKVFPKPQHRVTKNLITASRAFSLRE